MTAKDADQVRTRLGLLRPVLERVNPVSWEVKTMGCDVECALQTLAKLQYNRPR